MLRSLSAVTAALMALSLPVTALADKPAHAGNGNGKTNIERKLKQNAKTQAQTPKQARKAVERETRAATAPVVVGGRNPVVVPAVTPVQARHCPPGLAKKDPACIPPGQAKKMGVGRVVDWQEVHVISRPGLYGLTDAPRGQRYAIVDGRLIRIDESTRKILSIIRLVDTILD